METGLQSRMGSTGIWIVVRVMMSLVDKENGTDTLVTDRPAADNPVKD